MSGDRRSRAAQALRPPRNYTARQPADGLGVADLITNLLDQRAGDIRRCSVAPIPAKSCRNRLSTCWPCGECMTSGWYWTPGQPAGAILKGRYRAPALAATTSKPVGAAVTASPWLIHTGWVPVVLNAVRHQGLPDRCGRTHWCPYARRCRPAPAPWPEIRSRCRNTGTPRSNSAGSSRGAPSAYTLDGPP